MKRKSDETFADFVIAFVCEGLGSCIFEGGCYGIIALIGAAFGGVCKLGFEVLAFCREPGGERLGLILFDWISVAAMYYVTKRVIIRRRESRLDATQLVEEGEAWRYK